MAGNQESKDAGIGVQLVDALNGVFGVHSGARAAHAKGIVCEGKFTPSAAAASLTRAAHLQGEPIPVTLRFSDGSGIPTLSSADPNASPHGIAIRFHAPGGVETDLLGQSYDGFPVATPEELAAMFKAIGASGPEAPKPTPIEEFLASHPRAKQFVEAPKPPPVSYATLSYYGINAFKFTNARGESKFVRYRIRPVTGEASVEAGRVANLSGNYLVQELVARLKSAPAEFRISVQVAAAGDPVDDATASWPAERPEVELGTLAVTAIAKDGIVAERKLIFDPLRLVDGIEPSADPILPARRAAYSVSYERRNQ